MRSKSRPGRKYVAVPHDYAGELDDSQLRVQEFAPPPGLSGRLRVVGYPLYDEPPAAVIKLPLTFGSFEGAIATPRRPARGEGRVGALYTADGERLDASHRGKTGRGWDENPTELPDTHANPARVVPGRSLYAGHWGPIFGHILLETLPRFWPDVDYSVYDHLVFYPKRLETTSVERKPYLDDLLTGAGVGRADFVMLTHGGARFEQIDVASVPVVMKEAIDLRFLDVFERIAGRLLADFDPEVPLAQKVYLSRSHLPAKKKRTAKNEDHIEEMLGKQGFTILHPQEMSIAHQVAAMRAADVIAGCDGSAMHMSAFAQPGTKLLAIDSRTVPNQFLIDYSRELDAVHVLAVDGELEEHSGTWKVQGQKVRLGLDLLLSS